MSALEICFCCPAGDYHLSFAYRFLQTYLEYPPLLDHELIVLSDPANVEEAGEIFALAPKLRVVPTPDFAKDLSRYESWVKQSSAECVMLLGGSTYCRRPGWGLRAYTTFKRLGPNNLFGACGNNGAGPVHYHIRTTGFWGSPSLLSRYPRWPKDPSGRYEMEHGQGCLTRWVTEQGGQAYEVTFQAESTWPNFNSDPAGYARGNQFNLLLGDRLTSPPYMAFP
jgi:hypothetical protein